MKSSMQMNFQEEIFIALEMVYGMCKPLFVLVQKGNWKLGRSVYVKGE
jgi:hypothetical protein